MTAIIAFRSTVEDRDVNVLAADRRITWDTHVYTEPIDGIRKLIMIEPDSVYAAIAGPRWASMMVESIEFSKGGLNAARLSKALRGRFSSTSDDLKGGISVVAISGLGVFESDAFGGVISHPISSVAAIGSGAMALKASYLIQADSTELSIYEKLKRAFIVASKCDLNTSSDFDMVIVGAQS